MASETALDQAFFALIEQAFDGIAVWVPGPWRVVYANEAFGRLMAEPPGATVGDGPLDRRDSALRVELLAVMDRLVRDRASQETQSLPAALVGGSMLDVRLCAVEFGGQPAVGMIVREAAQRPASGSVAAHRRDPLTGLADREFLLERIATLLREGNATGRSFAVLFLDLDHFKQVNDEFGHLLGDDVLREAARRIADCVRDGDHVARYGGDEFVVIVDRISTADEVEPIVARIRAALSKPIALADGEVTLSATVGVALASEGHRTAEEVLSAADQAMYAAKHGPKN